MNNKIFSGRIIRSALYTCAILAAAFLQPACSPASTPRPAPVNTHAIPATEPPPPTRAPTVTPAPASTRPITPFIPYSDAARKAKIDELISKGQIEIQAHGSGIDDLELDLRKLIEESLDVEIPAGTLFVSQEASIQNMVVRRTKIVHLKNNDWLKVILKAACANMERGVPATEHEFSLTSAPEGSELAALMPVLDSMDEDYDIQQAAVWICTDNANYEELGRLGTGPGGIVRAIDPDDAARAMQIVSKAGIDIKGKAIWGDRREIIAAVKDNSLARWLQKLEAEQGSAPSPAQKTPASPEQVILVAHPACPAPRITTVDEVILRVRWGAKTPALAEANSNHFSFVLRLDGVDQGDIRPYRQMAETYSSLERYGCGHGATLGWVHWDVPLGRLSAGKHTIAVNYILDEAISDGLDEYDAGPFGFLELPFEVQP